MAKPSKLEKKRHRKSKREKTATKKVTSSQRKQKKLNTSQANECLKKIFILIIGAISFFGGLPYLVEYFSPPYILIEVPQNPSTPIGEQTILVNYKNRGNLLDNIDIWYRLEPQNIWELAPSNSQSLGRGESSSFTFTAEVNRSCSIIPPEYVGYWIDNETNQCYINLPQNISLCNFTKVQINVSGTYTNLLGTYSYTREFECVYPFAESEPITYMKKNLEPNASNYRPSGGGGLVIIIVQYPPIKDCLPYPKGKNNSLIFKQNIPLEYGDFNLSYREMSCLKNTILSKEEQEYCQKYLTNYSSECTQVT